MTTKQLEQETGCKIMVRGKGSMRDKKKVREHGCHLPFLNLAFLKLFARNATILPFFGLF